MASRMEEFRTFVNKHPKLREEVQTQKRSWQNIYEDWVILGESHDQWNQFQEKKQAFNPQDLLSGDNLKTVMGYLKKINPDSITKTLGTVQKVLQITQSVGARSKPSLFNSNYNSWWD